PIGVIPNPTGIHGFEGINQGVPGTVGFLVGLMVIATAASSLVIRFRRAHAEERLQLRWIAFGTAFAVAINVIYTLVGIGSGLRQDEVEAIAPFFVIVGFGVALPAGFALAILRYRLYDLDLFLNRTVLYGAVTVVLLLIFGLA